MFSSFSVFFAAAQRIAFADKITLGQSAVLGIMSVNFRSSRIPSTHPSLHQYIKPPFDKPIQLARDGLLPLVPRFRVPAKPGSPEVADREMDEVGWNACRIVRRLTTRQASTSLSGPSPCYVTLPARISAACSPSVSFLECAREQSPRGS